MTFNVHNEALNVDPASLRVTASKGLTAQASSIGTTALVAKRFSSAQTANIIEAQTSTGVMLAGIDVSGNVVARAGTRSEVALRALGLLSETSPLRGGSAGSIPTAGSTNGQLTLGLIGLMAGDVVTGLVCCVTTVGSGLTFVKMGLFKSDGTFCAATAESTTAGTFNSATGTKPLALTAPYTVTTTGGYYVGFLQYGSGATGATLLRGANATGVATQVNSGLRFGDTVDTQTDIAATVTLGANSNTPPYWFGAY